MKHTLPWLIFILLVLLSCQKEEHEPALPILKEPVEGGLIKSITQDKAVFHYEFSTEATVETGVYISMDSLRLATTKGSGSYFRSTYDANLKKYIAEAVALKPYTTYWYTIKSEHAGSVSYSKIAKFTTLGFDLKWQEGFTKKLKLVEPLYRDLILEGENVDTDLKNYEVMFGNLTCTLRLISQVQDVPGRFVYAIQVPTSAPVGIQKFTVRYKSIKIFEDNLEVEKGNIYTIKKVAQHPNGSMDLVYFKYNNKVYTISLSSGTDRMTVWDPRSNHWEKRAMPGDIDMWRDMHGVELDGKIYFPAFSKTSFSEGTTHIASQERVYTYDPLADRWDYYVLHTSTNSNDRLIPYGTFAYQGKFYCFVGQTRVVNGVYKEQQLLKVLDPVDGSWNTVMELKNGAWGYRAVVIQGSIHVLESLPRNEYTTRPDFEYALYTLDLNSKTLTRKSPPVFYAVKRGAWQPAVFEHNNRMYVYGGISSVGFFGSGTIDLYEYAPETDSWTLLFLSPNNAIPSQQHFAYVLNGKVYLGLGLTTRSLWNNDIWELDLD